MLGGRTERQAFCVITELVIFLAGAWGSAGFKTLRGANGKLDSRIF